MIERLSRVATCMNTPVNEISTYLHASAIGGDACIKFSESPVVQLAHKYARIYAGIHTNGNLA